MPVTVRLDAPRASEAFMEFEKGGLYSRTLLFSLSTTHKLPEESNASPNGPSRLPAHVVCPELARHPGRELDVVKFVCPMTSDALIPLEKGD